MDRLALNSAQARQAEYDSMDTEYTAEDLTGLKVSHDMEHFSEGRKWMTCDVDT